MHIFLKKLLRLSVGTVLGEATVGTFWGTDLLGFSVCTFLGTDNSELVHTYFLGSNCSDLALSHFRGKLRRFNVGIVLGTN